MKTPVGVIGVGIMGSAISANLVKAGFAVHGYDIVPARRSALRRTGGMPSKSITELCGKAEILITSLPSAAALHEVVRQLGKNLVVETSTLALEDKLAAQKALKAAGGVLLDCPLSGTGAQAKTKDLSVYGSGPRKSFERVISVLSGFARSQHYLGAFGNGTKMKFVANLLVAIHNVSAAEAFVLGIKAGLDRAAILRVVGDGAGSSRMLQVRGPQMVAGRYDQATMKVEVWQKDMKIIGEFAAALGAATPLFNASASLYTAAMAQGFGAHDTASVCAVLERLSGVKRRA